MEFFLFVLMALPVLIGLGILAVIVWVGMSALK